MSHVLNRRPRYVAYEARMISAGVNGYCGTGRNRTFGEVGKMREGFSKWAETLCVLPSPVITKHSEVTRTIVHVAFFWRDLFVNWHLLSEIRGIRTKSGH